MAEQNVIVNRLEALRDSMRAENIQYYIIPTSDFHNSEYVGDYFKVREFLSGFTGSNGTLVVSETEAGLWTDGRYFIQAEKELAGTGIVLFRMLEEGVPTITEYLKEHVTAGNRVGVDGRVITAAFGKSLEQQLSGKGATLVYHKDLAGQIWTERPAFPCHPIMSVSLLYAGQSVEDKLKAVRTSMKEKGAESLFISSLDDIMWLFNIRGRDVACNPVALSYAFVTEREACLFLGAGAVTEEIKEYALENQILLKEYGEVIPFLEQFQYDGSVLYDDKRVSFLLGRVLEKGTDTVCAQNPTELLKARKNQTELRQMEKVYLQDSVAVTKFIYWLKKNIGRMSMTEMTAASYLDHLRAKIPGFLELSFPTISAYGANAAMMHYEATEESHEVLRPEGMLLVDSGGQYMGGTTDVTRTIVLGSVTDEMKKYFTAVACGMLQLSDAKFLYGCTGRNLDILARQPLWKLDTDYKCGTGHGVGYMLNVHEGPQSIRWRYVKNVEEAVLEAGMTVTNEPGVYLEGKYGIRTENVLAVQKDTQNEDGQFMSFKTLTYVPIDLDAIDISLMSEEMRKSLNRYHKTVYEKTAVFLTEEERNWLLRATRPI